MRRGVAVLTGVGLLALAYGVSATTPGQPVLEAPFATPAVIGQEAVSRHVTVTVHEVLLADEVEIAFWEGTTSGVWLVGELTAEAATEPQLLDLEVFLDGARYPSSGRLDDGAPDNLLDTGLPITGAFAVELPADALERPGARSVVIRIGAGGDARLDSVVELTVDLTALDHVDRAEYDGVRDGAR